jgi:CRISPR/Cas system-associated exonuclease Cas4 (RecB family)
MIAAHALPIDPAEFAARSAMGGRTWLAESLFSADFGGFPLAGIPDAVCFEYGKPAAIHEYKFTDSPQLQMSHRVQLLIYGYILEKSGFDVHNLVLTCVLIPRRFASEVQAVVTPEAANLIRDAVVDVVRRQKASPNWRLANFSLCDGVNVIVRAFRYDRSRAERELKFFAEFWSGTRTAWPTSKAGKCSGCLYNSLRRCSSSLIRYGATPTT